MEVVGGVVVAVRAIVRLVAAVRAQRIKVLRAETVSIKIAQPVAAALAVGQVQLVLTAQTPQMRRAGRR